MPYYPNHLASWYEEDFIRLSRDVSTPAIFFPQTQISWQLLVIWRHSLSNCTATGDSYIRRIRATIIGKGKQAPRDQLFQCHFINHKSHMDYSGIECVPPQWGAGYKESELWLGLLWEQVAYQPCIKAPLSAASAKLRSAGERSGLAVAMATEWGTKANGKWLGTIKPSRSLLHWRQHQIGLVESSLPQFLNLLC